MKVGVITAMSKEREEVAKLLLGKKSLVVDSFTYIVGQLGDNEVVLAESGIGKVNAAVGALNLIKAFSPDAIISTGVAGGVDPERAGVMDVVVSTMTAYHDVDCGEDNEPGQIQGMPRFFEADAGLLEVAKSMCGNTKVFPGLIASGDCFVSTRAQLSRIKAVYHNAAAVDMESAAIAQVCYIYKVPFISFRIISDIPGVENHYSQYFDFWERMASSSFGIAKVFLERIGKKD